MATVDRRQFVQGATAAAGALALAGPFSGYLAAPAAARPSTPTRLVPVADERDLAERLLLPEGFHYRSFHDTATPVTLDDETILPGKHDGMAAFPAAGGKVWLVRNHEINGAGPAFGAGTPYDPMARGGTTTVLVDRFGVVDRAFTSLNGTQMNCAGGRMPWGSWITCEETVNGPDVGPDFTGAPNTALTEPHGFIFDVPAGGQGSREPITAAGRFLHEAAAFDPAEGVLYLTEDNFGFPSGLYRYLPRNPRRTDRVRDGGRLQMLAVDGQSEAELAAAQPTGWRYRVHWVDIDDPAPTFPSGTTNDEALRHVGEQGRAQGAARFSRLEGAVFDRGTLWFTSTQGGGEPEQGDGPIADGYGNGSGQVWAYHPRSRTLRVAYQSPGPDTLDLPDNVTRRRRGGSLVICEDGGNGNYLRGLSPSGQLFDIAKNNVAGQLNDEFAGATFDADGHTLYVNIQATRAMTFAIWGPWQRLGV